MKAPVGTPASSRAEPLRIEATLGGPIMLPDGPPALDGMLAYAVALREQLPPPAHPGDCTPIEIPVTREPGGRFHLASFGVYRVELHDRRWLNRKFPVAEAQMFGEPGFNRIRVSAGAQKSYRIPHAELFLVEDRITWWCVGDAEPIRALLDLVPYIGKKRSVGLGRVREWRVEPCEPWGDGFPVARDGKPLRTLPADWPGLVDPPLAHRVLTFPYPDHAREELLATVEAPA